MILSHLVPQCILLEDEVYRWYLDHRGGALRLNQYLAHRNGLVTMDVFSPPHELTFSTAFRSELKGTAFQKFNQNKTILFINTLSLKFTTYTFYHIVMLSVSPLNKQQNLEYSGKETENR